MKLDIPYYIRQVLREQRMVHVPGIGTFSLDQKAASFNDDKTNISPPSLSISFNDDESDDESLLKYILDTGQLSEDKAKKKLEQFTQTAFNKLLNVDSFLIEGVGTINKRAEHDKVEFDSKLSDLTKEFNDLIPLNLTPISRFSEDKPLAAVNTDTVPMVKESTAFWPRILLLTLLLIASWFLSQYIINNYFNQSDTDDMGLVNENNGKEDESEKDPNEEELQQKYEEIDKLIDPQSENAGEDHKGTSKVEDISKTNLAETKQTEEDKLSAEAKEADKVVQEVVEEIKEEKAIVKTVEPKDDAGAKSIDESKSDKSTNKHADIIPESGECIIVVGSFIKTLNAIKMISLLERKGYKVYRSEYKGYTRVGLKYECIDEDLEAYLQTIRTKISKKAWYLDPLLDVPYSK